MAGQLWPVSGHHVDGMLMLKVKGLFPAAGCSANHYYFDRK